MSSPGASSTSSFASTRRDRANSASSGRTTPEPHNHNHSQQQQQQQHSHNPFHHHHHHHQHKPQQPSMLSQTAPKQYPQQQPPPERQPPRRSSTPAHAFQLPRFLAQPNDYSYNSSSSNAAIGSGSVPRRTSFGHALGGRLGALSAWGGGSYSTSPTNKAAGPASPMMAPLAPSTSAPSQPGSAASSPQLHSSDVARPPLPPPSPRREERRHICVPDGCGGFITVEQKVSR